ncbi:MAG: hypothetical protein GY711_17635 [bacterium]|nr:hypothetical protein [bacterium]
MQRHTPDSLRHFLAEVLLPHWIERGVAPDGSFYERLDRNLEPIDLGYTRLLSQCRQIFAFGELSLLGGPARARELALDVYARLAERYRDADGGWRFALGAHPSVAPETRDLYAHAFVLLASATAHRLGESPASLDAARATLKFVREHFAAPRAGYHEALDGRSAPIERVRRQNPHMHLLEGCLAMYEASGEEPYLAAADELLVLLRDCFYDPSTSTLGEFFDDEFRPHAEQGHIVEPGHHFEWIWLLRWRLGLDASDTGATHSELASIRDGLHAFALEHGEDREFGGFYGEVDRAGAVVSDTKRIWPATEALKTGDPDLQARALELLFERYLRGTSGAWNEVLNRDLSPAADHLPGTTMYHLVMGCRESLTSAC